MASARSFGRWSLVALFAAAVACSGDSAVPDAEISLSPSHAGLSGGGPVTGGGGGISRVTYGSATPFSGSGTIASPLNLIPCGSGQTYEWSGTTWACATPSGGSGGGGGSGNLSGSGTAHDLAAFTSSSTLGNSVETDDGTTFSVNGTKFQVTEANGNTAVLGTLTADSGDRVFDAVGTGLTSSGNTVSANLAGGACSTGTLASALSSGGTLSCSATGVVTGGTANTVPKYSGANALATSSLTDDGTTFKVNTTALTVTESSGNTAVLGTLTADSAKRVFDVAGTGLTSSTNTVALNMAGGTCSSPQSLLSISATGATTCTTASASTSTGTANTLAKYSTASNIANSKETDDGTTFSINGSLWQVAESTGNTSIQGTLNSGAILAPAATLTGAVATDTLTTGFVATAQTTTQAAVNASNTGTFNTTGGGLTDYAVKASSTATRSSGTNSLTNIGVYTTATGAQTNTALYADNGNVTLNASSGQTDVFGAFTGHSTGAFTSTLTADAGNRVFDVAGTGLASSGNTVSANLAGAACTGGQFVSAISSAGAGTCTSPTGGGTVTSGTLTANTLPKASTASNIVNSVVTDDGTNFKVNTTALTIVEASGNTAVLGTLTADAGNRVLDAVGTGLSQTANAVALNMAGGTCSAPNSIASISATGTTTCTSASASTSAGTVNTIPKYSTASNIANSALTDDGTTFKVNSTKFTVTEASGNTVIAGTAAITGSATADAGDRIVDTVTAGGGISQVANAIGLLTTCTSGQYLAWSGTAWACTSAGTTTNAWYGFGTDGTLTFDGTTTILGIVPSGSAYTLTRDIYATTLTINTGVTVNTGGYRMFASVALAGNGIISNNGQVGTAAPSSGFTGVAGGNGGAVGTVGALLPGGGGGFGGGSASGGQQGGGGFDPQGFTGIGGTGGAGTNGPGTGGAVATQGGEGYGLPELITARVLDYQGSAASTGFVGGTGGGGGGSTAGHAGGAGGGGGGGVVYIAAPATTFTGSINANGAAGGAGNAYGNASGGGGGGGGLILIFTKAGTVTYSAHVSGGVGGSANSGTAPGSAGGAGLVIAVDPGSPGNGGGTSTGTVTSITCGTGLTGGTITASGTCAIDNTVVQETSSALVSGCGAGSALAAIAANGTPTCVAVGGLSGGSTGFTPVWASSSTLGVGTTQDNGTTFTVGNFAGTVFTETTTTSGTVNDYALGSTTTLWRITTSGAYTITGWASSGVPDGREVCMQNNFASTNSITVRNENSGSTTAGDRFSIVGAADLSLGAGQKICFAYDAGTSRWTDMARNNITTLNVSGAANVAGTLTLSSVVNGSGRFSITNGAAQSSIFATTTGAQTTNNLQSVGGAMAGSFNTTAGALTEVSVTGATTSTRSSGANALTGIGGQFSASGAQVNYAIQTTAGDSDWKAGHDVDTGATAPTLSTCGTSPTITGSDRFGTIVTGTGGTACTITWAASYGGTAPSCVWDDLAGSVPAHTYSTGASATLTVAASHTVEYHCGGH